MYYLFSLLKNSWYILACILVLISRSIVIMFATYRKHVNHREFINRITMAGAKKILRIVKATYEIEYTDPDAMRQNDVYIFMSNHRSLFDIPLIFATIPMTIRPVTKAELFRIPFLGRAMRIGECVPVERNNRQKKSAFLQQVKEKLKSGISVWFFPEGTRSADDKLLPFKKGGFQLALDTVTNIVPVAIINTASVLPTKKIKIALNQTIRIRVGKPINIKNYLANNNIDILIKDVRAAIAKLIATD